VRKSTQDESRQLMSTRDLALLVVGITLFYAPCRMAAQRGGGAHIDRPIICVYDCPNTEGRSSLDDLKDFRRAMAVQATPEQRAAFAKVEQYTAAARDRLKDFRESQQKAPASWPLSDRFNDFDQALGKTRAGNQNFLASFSTIQKSSLKDIINRLEKADSELVKQSKALDQIVQSPKPDGEQVVSFAGDLDKALANFQNAQLALGAAMSILFPSAGQDVAFTLPQVTNSIEITGQSIAIPTEGAIFQTSTGTDAGNGQNLFNFTLVADLSDLQHDLTGLLVSTVNRSPRCSERIELKDAALLPDAPSSQVIAHLQLEHWICPQGPNGPAATVLAAGEGTIEIKLTALIDPNGRLMLNSETNRVEADSFFRELLQSGDIGVNLREQIAAAVLSALQKGADVKAVLPPVAKELATVHKAQFENNDADQLRLVLEGRLQFSDEQARQFATQLNQQLSARQTAQ
jgi:hypothetical protein